MNIFKMLFIGFCLSLAACSSNAPVARNHAGTLNAESIVTYKQGVIKSVKNVAIMGRRGHVVGTIGSVAGSILGARGTIAGSLIGSLIGGAIGSEADIALSKQDGLEITIQLTTGNRVVVTQHAEISFKAGDKVQLISQDAHVRVVHLQSNS